MKQQTIARPVGCSGIGIHTGNKAQLTFRPAEENTGVVFVRGDIESKPWIPALVENVNQVMRGTTIAKNGYMVHTVEHVMAAVAGMGIDNILIEVDGIEAPAGDGSSSCFVQALRKAGLRQQDAEKKVVVITEPLSYQEKDIHFLVLPHDSLKISFHIEYPNQMVGSQFESLEITPDSFLEKLSEARTFAFLEEVEELKRLGLIKGGSLENAVVISGDKILNDTPLRSPKELVRHKILDLLGDLYLLGMPIQGHVISFKSGHPSNVNLVRRIRRFLEEREQRQSSILVASEQLAQQQPDQPKMVMGIRKIMEMMPHRYPFLLVDRILEFEAEKRVVGIKNVIDQRAVLPGPFPGPPDHARRADRRGDGARSAGCC